MVEIFWLILLSGLFLFHSWYSIHYLVSMETVETPPTCLKSSQPQNRIITRCDESIYWEESDVMKVSIWDSLWALNISLLWDMMGLNLTSDTSVHPDKSSIIALSTHRLSLCNKILCQFHLFMADHSYIRLGSCIWCGQRDHKYYRQHGHSLETHEDQNRYDQHSLIWKHSSQNTTDGQADISVYSNRF